MKFLKENSYEISKLFVNQIGISIFALSLSFALNALTLSDFARVQIFFGISVFSLIFYGVLLYTAAWEIGSKDKVKKKTSQSSVSKDDSEKQPESPIKRSFLLALYAAIPQLLFSVLCALLIGVYMASGIQAFNTWSSLINIGLRLGSSQYAGFLQMVFFRLRSDETLYFFASSLGYIVLTFLPIGVTIFGYVFGYHDKKLISIFKK